MIDQGPQATHYFSDGFPVYSTLMYAPGQHQIAPGQHQIAPGQHQIAPGQHQIAPGKSQTSGKSQTYSVEGGHYLACLACKRHYFSRCIKALRGTVFLFIHCYNKRQRWQRQHPNYQANIIISDTPPFWIC